MIIVSAFKRMLAILALIGLVSAPLATSSAAAAMAMKMDMAMSDGMPCCPDDQPTVPDCAKDCPLAVVCTSVFVCAPMSDSNLLSLRVTLRDRVIANRDADPTSLASEPQPRPPKA